ncbi:hypothetical protein GWI33_008233 [Rhynchophorus ferrugineus]|uniref:Uncharacterized protein n=1 Tax=Rhynchophorus ferrugineus TaxID=354439 RepID=A0A834ID48_RHYFE|nr:hypothetical protein GWI33_008233 [Rhynchophorus ferrugineus]
MDRETIHSNRRYQTKTKENHRRPSTANSPRPTPPLIVRFRRPRRERALPSDGVNDERETTNLRPFQYRTLATVKGCRWVGKKGGRRRQPWRGSGHK